MLQGGTVAPIPGGLAGQPPLPIPDGLGAPPPEQAPSDQAAPDPLQSLQGVIEEFPLLLVALHDPQDVHEATKALHVLTGIQRRLMQASGASAQGQ